MSTLVRARVPADTFVLAETLSTVPDLRAEIQPTVRPPSGPQNPVGLLWATCEDPESLKSEIRSDGSLRDATLVAGFDQRREWLFRAEWDTDAASLPLAAAAGATLLTAQSQSMTWDVHLFFPDREALSRAYDSCDARSDFSIVRIRETNGISRASGTDLTMKQYEALVVAYRLGYYEIPREATAEEVADHFGISHQALSERLCRGHRNLIGPLSDEGNDDSSTDPFGSRLRFEGE
jgi:predicted DNA binding protein